MKKALLSLLLAFAFIPMTMGQTNGNATKGYTLSEKDTTICSAFTWIDGNEYSTTTVATYPMDSVIYVLNITRLDPVYDTLVALPMEGRCYVVAGKDTLRTEGINFATLTAANGCDSIIKVNLTLTNHDTVEVDTAACGYYDFHYLTLHQRLTSSNTGEIDIMVGNCDLHINADLTIHPTLTDTTDVVVEEAIAGCTFSWHGMTISDTNKAHYKMLRSVHGCDSLAAVKVIAYTGTQFDTVAVDACDRYIHGTDTIRTSQYYVIDEVKPSCTYKHVKDITIRPSYRDTTAVVLEQLSGDCTIRWRNHNYTAVDDTAYAVVTSAYGCDSLIGMTVVALTGIERDTTVAEHCGQRYPASGKWHDIIVNRPENYATYSFDTVVIDNSSAQCAKYHRLELTFVDNLDTITATACLDEGDAYDFKFMPRQYSTRQGDRDHAYFYESGSYNSYEGEPLYSTGRNLNGSRGVLTATGCKTYHTLELTVNRPIDSVLRYDTITVCDSYNYSMVTPSIHYTESFNGEIPVGELNTSSCRRNANHLNLTILKSGYKDTVGEYCFQYLWPRTGRIYTESGDYRKNIGMNYEGCDSIAVLHLTIHAAPQIHIDGDWTLAPGESAELTAVNTGSIDASSYTWYLDGAYVSSGDSYTFDGSDNDDNHDVMLVASSATGCNDTSWVTITYNVGIDDVDGIHVNIFPNPASRYLTIEAAEAISEVMIYNAVGQLVERRDVAGNHATLDLGGLAVGSYTLRLKGDDGSYVTRKFIVNK